MRMRTNGAVLVGIMLLVAACGQDETVATGGAAPEESTVQAPEVVTLEPILYVGHEGDDDGEFASSVYLGAEGKDELRALVAEALAATPETRPGFGSDDVHVGDIGLIDETDPDEYLFVTGGYYCTSGGMVLDVQGAVLELRQTELVSCDAPQPVSSVFRVERSALDADFDLLHRPEGADQGNVVMRVQDWAVVG